MDADELCEVYLVVRPEERRAVERALDAQLPPVVTSFHALGRGRGGGLRHEGATGWWPFGRARAGEFLPKVVFYLAVPARLVDDVVDAVTTALRGECGAVDHGLGAVFVLPAEREIPVHPVRASVVAGAAS
ncbi:MAG: hypothetical protein IT374_25500 [Polyangiaceae bacterium]|nr:hypothetical protein [Polyangiaceae bacterium]